MSLENPICHSGRAFQTPFQTDAGNPPDPFIYRHVSIFGEKVLKSSGPSTQNRRLATTGRILRGLLELLSGWKDEREAVPKRALVGCVMHVLLFSWYSIAQKDRGIDATGRSEGHAAVSLCYPATRRECDM